MFRNNGIIPVFGAAARGKKRCFFNRYAGKKCPLVMKLKLADYVISGAKHLLHSEAKQIERVAALIRHRTGRASERCAKIGRDTEVRFHKSLKEFLAFFCVIAVNEMAIRSRRQSDAQLKAIYEKLIKAICDGHESDKALLEQQLTIRGILTPERSGFDHWFYGYWNADLEGMRITKEDLRELEERRIEGPTGNYCADASLILLVRISRLENGAASLPSDVVILEYDRMIREEVSAFVKRLKEILK